MSKIERVLLDLTDVCLFCGNNLKSKHEYEDHDDMDGHWIYFCNCPDFLKHKEIMEKIKELEKQLPEEKFQIKKEKVLYKI